MPDDSPHYLRAGDAVQRTSSGAHGEVTHAGPLHALVFWNGASRPEEVDQLDPDLWVTERGQGSAGAGAEAQLGVSLDA